LLLDKISWLFNYRELSALLLDKISWLFNYRKLSALLLDKISWLFNYRKLSALLLEMFPFITMNCRIVGMSALLLISCYKYLRIGDRQPCCSKKFPVDTKHELQSKVKVGYVARQLS
jgi:hypothetical protein